MKLLLNFLLNRHHKNTVLDFRNFEFLFFNKFLNFTIVPYGGTKTSIIWKTSDHRVKRTETWASGISVQCIQVTFLQLSG